MKAEVLATVLCPELSQAERVTNDAAQHTSVAVWYHFLLKRNRDCSGEDRACPAALTLTE